MHEYEAVIRLDSEEDFCTETIRFTFGTTVLSEAAVLVEREVGWLGTLIELRRIV